MTINPNRLAKRAQTVGSVLNLFGVLSLVGGGIAALGMFLALAEGMDRITMFALLATIALTALSWATYNLGGIVADHIAVRTMLMMQQHPQ